jgi:hypothetical protein
MFCANCGAKIDDDARFCNFCGSPVEDGEVSAGTSIPHIGYNNGPVTQPAPKKSIWDSFKGLLGGKKQERNTYQTPSAVPQPDNVWKPAESSQQLWDQTPSVQQPVQQPGQQWTTSQQQWTTSEPAAYEEDDDDKTINLEMEDDDDDKTVSLDDAWLSPVPVGVVVLQEKANPEKIYEGGLDGEIVIGRDPKATNITIEGDKSVSRRHCRIYKENNVCYVEDLQSNNHTFVNEQMITAPTPLNGGETLHLGRYEMLVMEVDMNRSPQ